MSQKALQSRDSGGDERGWREGRGWDDGEDKSEMIHLSENPDVGKEGARRKNVWQIFHCKSNRKICLNPEAISLL